MMSKTAKRLLLLGGTTLLVGLLAEGLYRAVRTTPPLTMHFRDGARNLVPDQPTATEDLAFRMQIQVPWPRPDIPPGIPTTPPVGQSKPWFGTGYEMPRDNLLGNVTWKPGSRFFICYRGPQQPYFDADGCVEYAFNRFGMRERDDVTLKKPAGEQRVVCLGDSFTLGWGVRREHNWPVLVEGELQRQWPSVRVLNCGGTGSAYTDEYELALRHRHGRFKPDLVLVTLCLNDLFVTNGKLGHYRLAALPYDDIPPADRSVWMNSLLLRDLARNLAAGSALELDPERDWIDELMSLPADHPWYRVKHETPDVYWVGGTPQRALQGIRDWCNDHDAKAAIVIWPLLQGLGKGRTYPFGKMHDLVRTFCEREGIPCLDLLPVLKDHEQEALWVSPADMHPNEHAQTLVYASVAAFVADGLGLK
ncbi:MAG: SGNH/GDSL hydrolase family protein [bacterium]|nr:SGNH/GDSL hydrolase family protein [bacterium]